MAVKKPRARTRRSTPPPPPSGDAQVDVSAEELRQLISEAAYYRAKQRGFAPGHELEDWIQAEQEIMRRIQR